MSVPLVLNKAKFDREIDEANVSAWEWSRMGYTKRGFLYIFEAGEKISKIGMTINDPRKRHKEIQSGFWYEVNIKYVCYTEYPIKYELIIHRLFKDYRMRGEWFSLSPNTIYDNTCKKIKWVPYDEGVNYSAYTARDLAA